MSNIATQNNFKFSLIHQETNEDIVVKEEIIDMNGENGLTQSKYIVNNNEASLKEPTDITYIKVFATTTSTAKTYKCKGLSLKYTKSE